MNDDDKTTPATNTPPATPPPRDAAPNSPPAAAAGEAGSAGAAALTPELQRLIDAEVQRGLASYIQSAEAQRTRDQAREAFIATEPRLKGVPELVTRQLGADPARWPAEAATLAAEWNAAVRSYLPDFGGASKDGGTVPNDLRPNPNQPAGAMIAAGLRSR